MYEVRVYAESGAGPAKCVCGWVDERTRLICSLISIDNHGVLIKSLPSCWERDFGVMFCQCRCTTRVFIGLFYTTAMSSSCSEGVDFVFITAAVLWRSKSHLIRYRFHSNSLDRDLDSKRCARAEDKNFTELFNKESTHGDFFWKESLVSKERKVAKTLRMYSVAANQDGGGYSFYGSLLPWRSVIQKFSDDFWFQKRRVVFRALCIMKCS